jgi:hypothetical protein
MRGHSSHTPYLRVMRMVPVNNNMRIPEASDVTDDTRLSQHFLLTRFRDFFFFSLFVCKNAQPRNVVKVVKVRPLGRLTHSI